VLGHTVKPKQNMSLSPDSIKSRLQEAKVYAVLFREEATQKLFLSITLAYSLEDVYDSMRRTMPSHEQWLPYMWHFTSMRELVMGATQIGVITEQKKEEKENKDSVPGIPEAAKKFKNELMKKIIESGDEKLFKDNMIIFSPSEVKYIKNEMKKKNG
jgi:hypothetical protein